MASSDVRKRQERNTQQPGVHVEAEQGAIDVRSNVAVAQHYALGNSCGAGRIDDGREVAGLDRAGERFSLRIEGAGASRHELIHERAGWGQIASDLYVIHDYDSFDLRLRENRLDLAQLEFSGDENDRRARVAQ